MPELTAPTKQRPGDQRLPDVNDRPCIQDAIIEDMEESKRLGIERYGTTLQPFNGRDTLQDARDEARDGLVYLTALKMEREEMAGLASAILREAFESWQGVPVHVLEDLERIVAWLNGEPF